MEIKKREKTLAGLFSKYIAVFCISTLLLAGGVFLLLLLMTNLGLVLPANYAESALSEHAEEIRGAGDDLETWIPEGCTYGLYDREGVWLAGDFPEPEQKAAWGQYEKESISAGKNSYYRFMKLDNGKLCIVKYQLAMRYTNSKLNELLPGPEILMPILDILLFLGNVVLLSRSFAKKLQIQLGELREITEKIAGNDLEFETGASDIKEINEVMSSFGQMKNALQASLKAQWDMEKQKQEQLAALAHDVKTPLTIIRGNAELLEEEELSGESRECAAYILANVKEIEQYLETMRQVLRGREQAADKKLLSCRELEERFRETAKQMSAAEKIPVSFDIRLSEGWVLCNEESMVRAWSNLVSNGAEHTDRKKGLAVSIREESKAGGGYLAASVRDYGAGFTEKALQYADQEFYSGDTSRHDRKHQGLGLAIAKRFLEEQGGFLEFKNSEGSGAEVSLWIKLEEPR